MIVIRWRCSQKICDRRLLRRQSVFHHMLPVRKQDIKRCYNFESLAQLRAEFVLMRNVRCSWFFLQFRSSIQTYQRESVWNIPEQWIHFLVYEPSVESSYCFYHHQIQVSHALLCPIHIPAPIISLQLTQCLCRGTRLKIKSRHTAKKKGFPTRFINLNLLCQIWKSVCEANRQCVPQSEALLIIPICTFSFWDNIEYCRLLSKMFLPRHPQSAQQSATPLLQYPPVPHAWQTHHV